MSRWGFGCALAALLCGLPATATTIVRVDDRDLVVGASLVVVAEIVERGPAASGAAAVDYRLAVEEVLKGTVGPELTITVPGGMGANGVGRRIFGAPSFAPGERAILFLEERAGGGHRILHLMQGAFREVRREGRSLALRDLADVSEVRLDAGAVDPVPAAAAEPVRDFDAFVRWIADSARGAAPAADYRVALPAGEEDVDRLAAPFTLFGDFFDGLPIRWFVFDTGGSVPWRISPGGQPGVPGGGQSEFQAALQAWNADSQTPIRYVFAGTSGATGGLCIVESCGFDGDDGVNVLLTGDPNDELTNLSAECSGTLAYGGPWYTIGTRNFRGQQYHEAEEADIVLNDGLECFFNASPNPRKTAEQLFGHEVGHTLGIDHSCGNPGGPDQSCSNPVLSDALMRAFVHDDARGAKLNSDDLAAARALYRQGPAQPGNPPAAPTNLTAEGVSTTEIEIAWQDNSANETGFIVEVAPLGGDFSAVGTVAANTTLATVFNLDPATGYLFRVKATNAQGTSAPTNVAQASTDALPAPCVPGAQTLCLAGGRFRVEVDWASNQGTSGAGQVVPGVSSDDSGLFYFFQESNWEMLVKVLAACPVNDRFWVFASATTDVEFTLTVTDTGTNKVRTYFNPQGTTAQTVTDTAAFATCP